MPNKFFFDAHLFQFTGADDLLYCSGDCSVVPEGCPHANMPEYVQDLYPSVMPSDFSVKVYANTGHAVNAHLSAPEIFQDMIGFIDSVFDSTNATTSTSISVSMSTSTPVGPTSTTRKLTKFEPPSPTHKPQAQPNIRQAELKLALVLLHL